MKHIFILILFISLSVQSNTCLENVLNQERTNFDQKVIKLYSSNTLGVVSTNELTTVNVRIPNASQIEIIHSGDNWRKGHNILKYDSDQGLFSGEFTNLKPGDEYKFIVTLKSGEKYYTNDIYAQFIKKDKNRSNYNSVVTDSFKWTAQKSLVEQSFSTNYISLKNIFNNKDSAAIIGTKILNDLKAKKQSSITIYDFQSDLFKNKKDFSNSAFTSLNSEISSPSEVKTLINFLHENGVSVNFQLKLATPLELHSTSIVERQEFLKRGINQIVKDYHVDGLEFMNSSINPEVSKHFLSDVNHMLRNNPRPISTRIEKMDNISENDIKLLGFESVGRIEPVVKIYSKSDVIASLIKSGTPAFLRKTQNGDLPIILLNNDTYPKVKEFIESSMGMTVSLHPKNASDHGWIRSGENLVDLYNPGQRNIPGGELHETGLSWKLLSKYHAQRKEHSRKMMDMAFSLNKKDLNTVEYLQRVRRSAMYRNDYAFYDGDRNKFFEMSKIEKNHRLDCSGEHCYTYPMLSYASSQVSSIISQLKKMNIDYSIIKNDPRVLEFQRTAREQILKSDVYNSETFNYFDLMDNNELRNLLKDILPKGITKKDEIKVMSYLASIPGIEDYKNLLSSLNIHSNFIDFNNARASALFIYDNAPEAAQKFRDATYSVQGKHYSLSNDGLNKPLK